MALYLQYLLKIKSVNALFLNTIFSRLIIEFPEHLKKKLEDYVSTLKKVKLVRTKQREGLIRARAYGADHSAGDVVIFLDSHCETNVGWLPPLLARIQADYRNVVCPTIEVIDHLTFSYRAVDPLIRGTFNWRFDYKERGITDEQRKQRVDETEPVKYVISVLFLIIKKGLFSKKSAGATME